MFRRLLMTMVSLWMGASIAETGAPAAAALVPTPSPSSQATLLIAALGQPAPARTAFAEARFMKVLDKPLVVSGELAWLGGDQLQRRVDHPKQETASIADGKVTLQRAGKSARTFSLAHAPQLQVLLDSFVALLSGDASRLQQAFDIQQAGRASGAWRLTLTPRDPKVAKSVGRIVVDGSGSQSRCMQMQEADGDVAIDLLGAMAEKMPAQPTREALASLCQDVN